MASNTTRLHLPYPEGSDRPPDVAQALQHLSQKLDQIAMTRGQGLFAARPTTATAGEMYWATDRREMYYHDGDAWTTMGPTGLLPIGGVLDWPAATTPPGPATWLELNGDPITRADYPDLFAAWNLPGQNANLPDRRGRSPMGAGHGPGLKDPRTVGSPVGEDEHAISQAELPNYRLTVNDSGHSHVDGQVFWADDNMASPFRITPTASAQPFTQGASVGHRGSASSTGLAVWLNGGGGKTKMTHACLVTRYFVRAR